MNCMKLRLQLILWLLSLPGWFPWLCCVITDTWGKTRHTSWYVAMLAGGGGLCSRCYHQVLQGRSNLLGRCCSRLKIYVPCFISMVSVCVCVFVLCCLINCVKKYTSVLIWVFADHAVSILAVHGSVSTSWHQWRRHRFLKFTVRLSELLKALLILIIYAGKYAGIIAGAFFVGQFLSK